jgi:hypothetical protein
MSDFNQTVDRPYAQQPATRAAAARITMDPHGATCQGPS